MSIGPSETISVVMPCYNGMPYLIAALDSALNQTVRPLEVLVVDDGSTDDSAVCVRHYQKQHPEANIRLVQQQNAGEPTARNTGINAARGHWVAMLDTDDTWHREKLEKQLAAAADMGRDCVLVHTGVVHCYADGSTQPMGLETPAKRAGWCASALLEDGSIGHPSILVRRDALLQIGGYDATFTQACDIDIYFRLSAVGTFAFVDEHLLNYRIHPGQMSRRVVDQIRFHHRAIRKFFSAQPALAKHIGRDTIRGAMIRHVEAKLKSLYWRRELDQFRELLEYAEENKFDSRDISEWRRRKRFPNWLIRARDVLPAAKAKDE
jgi:glycosyltransferase involved in cell wall biosynthesis